MQKPVFREGFYSYSKCPNSFMSPRSYKNERFLVRMRRKGVMRALFEACRRHREGRNTLKKELIGRRVAVNDLCPVHNSDKSDCIKTD